MRVRNSRAPSVGGQEDEDSTEVSGSLGSVPFPSPHPKRKANRAGTPARTCSPRDSLWHSQPSLPTPGHVPAVLPLTVVIPKVTEHMKAELSDSQAGVLSPVPQLLPLHPDPSENSPFPF